MPPVTAAPGSVEGRVGRESATVEVEAMQDSLAAVVDKVRVTVSFFDAGGTQIEMLKNSIAIITSGSTIRTLGEGMVPGSEAEIWINSDPALIDTVLVDDGGHFASTAPLPEGLAPGKHSLRVVNYVSKATGGVTETERVVSFEVAFGILMVDDHVTAMNEAGKVSLGVANRVLLPGFKAISVVDEGRAAMLATVLLLVMSLVVFFGGTPLVRRRRLLPDFLSGIFDEAPSLGRLGAWRGTAPGAGFAFGLMSILMANLDPIPGSVFLAAVLVVLGVIDPVAGLATATTTTVAVALGGGFGSISDVRALIVLIAMYVLPAAAASAVTNAFTSPRRRAAAPLVGGVTVVVLLMLLSRVHHALVGVQLTYEAWMPFIAVGAGVAFAVRRTLDEEVRGAYLRAQGFGRMKPTIGIAPIGVLLAALVMLSRQFVGISSLVMILIFGIVVALRAATPRTTPRA